MTTTTFTIPTHLYRGCGDDFEIACSERDPYFPKASPMYFVPLAGGAVTADVLRPGVDTTTEGDPWDYDQPTGLHLTAEEVAVLITEEA